MLNLNYDDKYDILNISIKNSENSIGCEEYGGLVVMRDYSTKEATGFMLYGFVEKYNNHDIPSLPEDIHISIEDDVMPRFMPMYSFLISS